MAAVDYFIELEGIPGESQDETHKDKIHVKSWSFGATQEGSSNEGGGLSAGKVRMHNFNFVAATNKASPKLLLACASGEIIPKAVLYCRKAGKDAQGFHKLTYTNVLVTSFTQTGGIGQEGKEGIHPEDKVSFCYEQIEKEYKPQKADGTLDSPVTAGWNVKKNVKV